MLGMVNANRPLPELNNIVGFFVNSHALRLVVSPESTFADLIQVTRKVVMDALEHSDATFRDVVATLSPERNIARKSLIQLGKPKPKNHIIFSDLADVYRASSARLHRWLG